MWLDFDISLKISLRFNSLILKKQKIPLSEQLQNPIEKS